MTMDLTVFRVTANYALVFENTSENTRPFASLPKGTTVPYLGRVGQYIKIEATDVAGTLRQGYTAAINGVVENSPGN